MFFLFCSFICKGFVLLKAKPQPTIHEKILMTKQNITVLLANPRGFCAGVTRAIQIVEKALEKYGAPIYVRHEIVHNAFVVKELEKKGAVFVSEIDEVPEGRMVIFSAHGVPKKVLEKTKSRGLKYLDATCPLVEKVHTEVKRHNEAGRKVILIGHAGHPEVIGTMGQLPDGEIFLLDEVKDLERLDKDTVKDAALVTQTTLSVDETAELKEFLKAKIPGIVCSSKDICYATTNRQMAVKEIAPKVDMLIVVGSPNSSNSKRLVEVAVRAGCANSVLVEDEKQLNWDKLANVKTLGITAGASAPEKLIKSILKALRERFKITIEEIGKGETRLRFNLPQELEDPKKPS